MKLDLVKNEETEAALNVVDTTDIRFNFFKDTIKKDLEVVGWQNKAIKIFGDFQIYSDFQLELNSFDHIVAYLTGNNFDRVGASLEAHIACRCPEHFLKFLILKNYDFSKNDIDMLAEKYTYYVLAASDLLRNEPSDKARDEIEALDKKYFDGEDPTLWKYLDPQFLN